jgi:hypothetical protein
VHAAAELALSALVDAQALNANEIQRALAQCGEQNVPMLEKVASGYLYIMDFMCACFVTLSREGSWYRVLRRSRGGHVTYWGMFMA